MNKSVEQSLRRTAVLFGFLSPLAAGCPIALASIQNAAPKAPLSAPIVGDAVAVRAAGTLVLRHLYAVYLGLRTCAEVASETGRVAAEPVVGIEEARRVLKEIDPAASKAGIDVKRSWSEAAPSAVVTAEALRLDTPENQAICHKLGSVFRIDAANLQALLARLGASAELIEKDF